MTAVRHLEGVAAVPSLSPTVVFVAGSGRSGSTLVERAIGAAPGFVNVGEILDLFRQALANDERCGCGEPLSRCPFWAAVTARSEVLRDPAQVDRMRSLQRRLVRQRQLARLLRGGDEQFADEVREYGQGFADIFRAVADVARASTVVDASKWPVQALALWSAGLDVRVLHVVRDPRGVVYSQGKRDVERPQDSGGEPMERRGVANAAARWTTTQLQPMLLRRRGVPTAVLAYEDFVRDPGATVRAALTDLGIPTPPADLGHLAPGRARLPQSHGIAGNPSRFRSGDVVLRDDQGWRDGLSKPQRAVVAVLAGPPAAVLRHRIATLPETAEQGEETAYGATLPTPTWAPIAPGEWPDISVIIPTRGRPELVRDTLRGVVAQSYAGELDIVVVHDQEPEDQTLAELGGPGREITVTSNTHTPGLAGARNTGLALTGRTLVASCDDDDVWHVDKLTKQVDRLRVDPTLGIVGSGIRLMLPDGVVTPWPARAEVVTTETLLRNRVKELHSSTLVMHREVFEAVGGYDETLPHGYGEDYDWVLRAARVGRVGCVTEPLADINKRVQSWYQGRSSNTLDALTAFLERHPEIRTSRRGYARVLGQTAFVESTMGRRRDAARHAFQGLRTWPPTPHVWLAFVHIITRVDPAHLLRLARTFGRGLS